MKLKTSDARIPLESSALLTKINKYCRKKACESFSPDCQECDLRYTAKGNYNDGPDGMHYDSVLTCLKEALNHVKKKGINNA